MRMASFLFFTIPLPCLFLPLPHQTTGPILVKLAVAGCQIMWACQAMMRAFATVLGLTFVKRTP